MKNLNTHEMINSAISEIEKFAPKRSHVEIEVKEDPVGNFITLIRIHAKEKLYIAKKEDMYLYKSFTKAMRAIKAQVEKRRGHHEPLRSGKYYAA